MKNARILLCFLLLPLVASLGQDQATTAPALSQAPRDAQGLTLISQAWAKLAGGTTIQDATLTGTATWIVGPDREQVSTVLKVRGPFDARLELAGRRTELQTTDSDGNPKGEWIGSDTVRHAVPSHNSWVDSGWFFPARLLQVVSLDPNMAVNYVGQESRGGVTVEHISVWRYVPTRSAKVTALIGQWSRVDVYLDSRSLLPLVFRFNAHPDDDSSTNIPIEVRYSDYRQIGTLQLPGRVTKRMNGSLLLDLQVSSATVNTGLSDSDFAAN